MFCIYVGVSQSHFLLFYCFTGSAKEREIFKKAANKMRPPPIAASSRMAFAAARGAMPEAPAVKPEFSGSFKNGETQVGEDLIMVLTLKSTAANTRTVKVNMTATAIIYNSTPVKEILTDSQSVTLGANEGVYFSISCSCLFHSCIWGNLKGTSIVKKFQPVGWS